MNVQWNLLKQVDKNNQLNYSQYRCQDPVGVKTGEPWYPYSNVCPCNPDLSNTSGRGFTPCPMGLSNLEKRGPSLPMNQIVNQIPKNSQVVGTLYSEGQAVPPQLEPRQLSRIGQQWRSGN